MQDRRPTIAMLTIGQAPREDVVPAMRPYFPPAVRVVEYGALDDLNHSQIEPYLASEGEVGIVTQLRDGTSVLLSHERILPAMQEKVDLAVERDGADVIVVLCGADWSALQSPVLLVNPGTVFPSVISTLARGRTLGVIKPSAGQIEKERKRYRELEIEAIVTAASPYVGEERLAEARRAAEELRDAGCDLIWMTCVGMDEPMRDVVRDVTGVPVLLAHALLARITAELIGSRAEVRAGV
ncbi:MAG: AroM family protein [Chloroflexota bacterium]